MQRLGKIITVGISPSWDTVCRADGIEWGSHQIVKDFRNEPAGKALNVSRALCWMGRKSIAMGFWGREDHREMLRAVGPLRTLVDTRFTVVPGRTRQNITIIDTAKGREMHLRNRSDLAYPAALEKLERQLKRVLSRDCVCVFAGSMPEEYIDQLVRIKDRSPTGGAKIVLDTSGQALKKMVETGKVWLVKPNVKELAELLDRKVPDRVESIVAAAEGLLDKVEIVLISRAAKGAIAVTKKGVWKARSVGKKKVVSTVGCGDYLLAGFLAGLKSKASLAGALETGIKAATAKALGWAEIRTWAQAQRQVKLEVERAK